MKIISFIITVALIVAVILAYEFKLLLSIWNVPGTKYLLKINSEHFTTLYNVPVRIILSQTATPNFDFSKCTYEDGSDVCFYDKDGNLLQRYIIRFSKTNKFGELFVKLPTLNPGTNTIYLVVGGNLGSQSSSVFDEIILLNDIKFQPANPYNPTISLDSGVEAQSNKISFTTDTSRLYGAAMDPSKLSNNTGRIIFFAKKHSDYTGSDSGFQVLLTKDGLYLMNLCWLGNNYITVNRETSSTSGGFVNDVWYEFDYSYDLSANKCFMTIYSLDGKMIYSASFGKDGSTYNVANPLFLVYHGAFGFSSSPSYTIGGTFWTDFYAFSSQPLYSTITYNIEATTTTIEFLSGTQYPANTLVNIKLRLKYGDSVVPNKQLTFRLDRKGDFLGFEITVTTDSNGVAEFQMKTPSSTYSPYSGSITVDNSTYTFSFTILKAFTVSYTKIPTVSEYDLSDGYDLVIEGRVNDLETNNPVNGPSVTATVKGQDGRTVESTVETSPSSNSFTVKAKVHKAYGDLVERYVNVSITVSSSGYYSYYDVKTVKMTPPKVQALLVEPTTTIFPVGTNKIKLQFAGTTASTLKESDVKVVIVKPDGSKIDASTLNTYWQSGDNPTYSIWYTFDVSGTYSLQVTINITPVQYQEITLYVTEQQFSIPWNYIILGIIVLIILYWLFKR